MARKIKSTRRRTLVLLGIVILSFVVLMATMSLFSSKPANLGVREGQLAACPSSPNCVSTQATGENHKIEPIEFAGTPAVAIEAIKSALGSLPGVKVISETENYLHAEVTSSIFRFVDDVEFYVDAESKLIHFRSASRTGKYDFGTNRSRLEQFRVEFERLRN